MASPRHGSQGDPSRAQFQAADAEASALAAAVQDTAAKPSPVSKAQTSPAPTSVAKDSEVAPSPQLAAWNVTSSATHVAPILTPAPAGPGRGVRPHFMHQAL